MKKALSRKNIWELTPPPLKRIIGSVLRPIPIAWLLGRGFMNQRDFARQAQWWPGERSREYQLERLRNIVERVYGKTRFYRAKFESLGFRPGDMKTLDDLRRLPTIDKQIVNDNLSGLCTRNIRDIDVDFGSTGGGEWISAAFLFERRPFVY
jgi:hypothetical protein